MKIRAVVAGFALWSLCGSLALPVQAAESNEIENMPAQSGYTTTDTGSGAYGIPMLNTDVPDISVMRLPKDDPKNHDGRDVYYMVSTTMELSPGAPIMKSYDLVNWQMVTYVYDRISMSDASSLRNGASSYGEGEWAPSLRYHDGKFYVLFNTNNLNGAYLYITDDIEHGQWQKIALNRGFHDPSLYFDDQGRAWIISGVNEYRLSDDLQTVVESHENIITAEQFADDIGEVPTGFEGSQTFKIGQYYYTPTIYWGRDGRTVMLLRTTDLLDGSKYEAKKYALGGFAQGSLVEVANDDGGTTWYGFFFRDTYPTGRIPGLIPAVWSDDGWPVFGDNNTVSTGDVYDKPISLPDNLNDYVRMQSLVASDDFANDAPHQSYQDQDWWTLPTAPDVDESLIGTELVENGGFEQSIESWTPQYGGTLSVTEDSVLSGGHSLEVTNRGTLNGAGPGQSVEGKIQPGVTYRALATIRYDAELPDVNPAIQSHQFYVALKYNNEIHQIAVGNVQRGVATTIEGTFSVPTDAVLTDPMVIVETQWGAEGTCVDYVIDDISLMGLADQKEYPVEDEYLPNGSNLDMAWEWAHNPDNRYWSLTDRAGWLRLTNGHLVSDDAQYMKGTHGDLTYFETARNMLSQRTFGGHMSAETKLDVSHMRDGDTAGIATYTRSFSYAAVRQDGDSKTLGVVSRVYDNSQTNADGSIIDDTIDRDAVESFVPGTVVSLPAGVQDVWLKSDNVLDNTSGNLTIQYWFSLDGHSWQQLGGQQGPFTYDWSLSHFKGYRIGLFNYARQATGGYVDYDYYYLSDKLSSDYDTVDTAQLSMAIAAAKALRAREYPASDWQELQKLVEQAEEAFVSQPSTQNEIDAPQRALSVQLAYMKLVRTDNTGSGGGSEGQPPADSGDEPTADGESSYQDEHAGGVSEGGVRDMPHAGSAVMAVVVSVLLSGALGVGLRSRWRNHR